MLRFLASRPPAEQVAGSTGARAIIQGVAYDGGVSWRRGAAEGPGAIREASDSIESYSPVHERDLADEHIVDVGDVMIGAARGRWMAERVATATEQLARSGSLVVTLGGDHSISIGTSRGIRAVHPDVAHIVFDAHLDMRASYDGDEYSHACGTRHMAEAGPTAAFGIRSGSRQEFEDAARLLVGFSDELAMTRAVRTAIKDRPVFVSVDLDVLDPSVMPGTGNPEPGGVGYRALRDALLSLSGFDVVGIDLVECAPRYDASGASAVLAAELAREGILAFLRSGG